MAEPINLNKARKARAKADATATAARNRVAYGLTKGQKAAAEALRAKATDRLDAHRREP
jgi:hypothetical protein